MPEHDVAPTFVIARNPEARSRLGYLVRLPLSDGDVVLKAADTWPRTAKLYCHPGQWPDTTPEIVESVPVRTCRRRGVAIDLVLERPRERLGEGGLVCFHSLLPEVVEQGPGDREEQQRKN